MLRKVAFLLFLVLGPVALGGVAQADIPAEALASFARDSFSKTIEAINAVVATGDERSADVIRALKDGRLYFTKSDGKVYIKTADGGTVDAATGAPVTGDTPLGLKKVRLNNQVRGAVEAALGSLNLLARRSRKAPRRRRRGLQVRTMRTTLPAVEAALAKETDPAIKRVLEEARAAILLADAKTCGRRPPRRHQDCCRRAATRTQWRS